MSDVHQDPRREKSNEALDRTQDPIVGGKARHLSPFAIMGAFAVLAVALFLFLNARRTDQTASIITPVTGESTAAAPLPPPLDIAPRPAPSPPAPVLPPPQALVAPPVAPPPPDDTAQRLHAPSVVVDLQSGRAMNIPIATTTPSGAATGGAPNAIAPAKLSAEGADAPTLPGTVSGPAAGALAVTAGSQLLAGAEGAGGLSANDQFSAHVSQAPPEPSVATQMSNLGTTVAQGATIPAVLETALSSDLPGYTRAVVTRDVSGFDGKQVLIPKGSRVVGQYRNAVALGQSRIFIIWTRVIRPDGVTVQIGSPGDDALGRAGLTGDVNTHFFARFGGGILLSILNGGIAAIAGTPSTQISIGSPAAAAGAAASAAIPTSTDIPPTITVKQGAAINIFVARDLDFSNVQAVK